jgi:hypothetical protein
MKQYEFSTLGVINALMTLVLMSTFFVIKAVGDQA